MTTQEQVIQSLWEKRGTEDAARALVHEIDTLADTDWLLIHELLELSYQYRLDASLLQNLTERLKLMQTDANEDIITLIQYGLDRFQTPQL